jgi:PPOX class probable F420-dependent enzyme
MLPWSWAVERLEAARSYWVATVRENGSPHAAPLWGLWLADGLVFSTSPESRKGKNLRRDPRVAMHLESGDEVVILEGEVEAVAIDDSIADAYDAKYGFRPDPADPSSLWLRLRPTVAYAWLEREYPRSATRFAFV